MQQQAHPRPVPLWQIAPFCLVPAVAVAAASYYVEMNLHAVLYTFALSCTALLLIAAPRKSIRWALGAAMLILGIVLILNGGSVAGLATAAANWAHASLGFSV